MQLKLSGSESTRERRADKCPISFAFQTFLRIRPLLLLWMASLYLRLFSANVFIVRFCVFVELFMLILIHWMYIASEWSSIKLYFSTDWINYALYVCWIQSLFSLLYFVHEISPKMVVHVGHVCVCVSGDGKTHQIHCLLRRCYLFVRFKHYRNEFLREFNVR